MPVSPMQASGLQHFLTERNKSVRMDARFVLPGAFAPGTTWGDIANMSYNAFHLHDTTTQPFTFLLAACGLRPLFTRQTTRYG